MSMQFKKESDLRTGKTVFFTMGEYEKSKPVTVVVRANPDAPGLEHVARALAKTPLGIMSQSYADFWSGDVIVEQVTYLCKQHNVDKKDIHFVLLGVACRFAATISKFNHNEIVLVDPFHVDWFKKKLTNDNVILNGAVDVIAGLVALFRKPIGSMLAKFMLKDCYQEVKEGLVDPAFVGEQLHDVFVKPSFEHIVGPIRVIYTTNSEDSLIDPGSLVQEFQDRPATALISYEGPYCSIDGLADLI